MPPCDLGSTIFDLITFSITKYEELGTKELMSLAAEGGESEQDVK